MAALILFQERGYYWKEKNRPEMIHKNKLSKYMNYFGY